MRRLTGENQGASPGPIEYALTVGLLFAFTEGFQAIVFGPLPDEGSGAVVDEATRQAMRLAWLPVYAGVLALALPRARQIAGVALEVRGLALLLLLCPLSVLWSVSPPDTLRRSAAMLLTALFGFYLAAAFDYRTLLRLLAWTLGLALALSLLVALAWPEVGVMAFTHAGAWRGIFAHKNVLGHMALLTMLVLAMLLGAGEGPRPLILFGLLLALAMFAASRSLAPLLIGGVLAQVVLLVALLRGGGLLPVAGGLMVGALFVFEATALWSHTDDLLAALGRDTTLSGRTLIWSVAWQLIEESRWLGYGYGAIWELPDGAGARVWLAVREQMGDPRSGYVDLWLDLGLVGVTALAAALLTASAGLLGRLRDGDPISVYWTATFLVYALLLNFVETYLSRSNNLFTVLLVTTIVAARHIPARSPPMSRMSGDYVARFANAVSGLGRSTGSGRGVRDG